MAKKKEMTFFTIVADVFKEKLADAGYRTIVRHYRKNSMNIHIQGVRKKHVISITSTKYRTQDPQTYVIQLRSDRLRTTYTVWDNSTRFEDPNFKIDPEVLADKIVEFMDHIVKINEHLLQAHEIFDRGHGEFRPDKKRVSRTAV